MGNPYYGSFIILFLMKNKYKSFHVESLCYLISFVTKPPIVGKFQTNWISRQKNVK